MGDLVPRKTMVKQGGYAFGGLAGGIALFALHAIAGPAHFLTSLIIGGAVALVGLAIGSSRDDRTAGTIVTAAGIVTAATAIPLIGGLAGALLTISGVGLLIVGGINLWKFVKNYRKRL